MKIMFAILCLLALAAGSGAARKTPPERVPTVKALEQTQAHMTQEACSEYEKADTEMNKAYKQILREYERQTAFIENLKKAQRAWIGFRNAHLESVYPDPNKLAAYGSVNPMCQCMTLTELTNQRTEVLMDRWGRRRRCVFGQRQTHERTIRIQQRWFLTGQTATRGLA